MDLITLLKDIDRKRDCGVSHLLVFDRKDAISWEDLIIEKSKEIPFFSWHSIWFYRKNKKGISEQTVSIDEVRKVLDELSDREKAITVLTQLLHSDMAYGNEMIPRDEARILATNFVSFFDSESKYYTGMGLTEATFDSGLIVVDQHKVGIAWFEDED